jgi:hypothetical protein
MVLLFGHLIELRGIHQVTRSIANEDQSTSKRETFLRLLQWARHKHLAHQHAFPLNMPKHEFRFTVIRREDILTIEKHL